MKKDLDKMLKNIETVTPPRQFKLREDTAAAPETEAKPQKASLSFGRKHLAASVALMLVAVIMAAVTLLVPLGSEDPTASDTNSTPSRSFGQDTLSGSGGTSSDNRAWDKRLDGLVLRSFTYSGAEQLSSVGRGRVSVMNNTANGVNNVLPLPFDTNVTEVYRGDLLEFTPTSGAHTECSGVYHSVSENRTFCLACELKEKLQTSDIYIDACVRAMIEECWISPLDVAADAAWWYYNEFYYAFYESGCTKVFEKGQKPTGGNVGAVLSGHLSDRRLKGIENFTYPVIKIVEYGLDPNKCLFAVVSGKNSDISWGCGIYDLTTSTFRKIDGDVVGADRTRDASKTYPAEINLAVAENIYVLEDYSKIVATVPYFITDDDMVEDENGIVRLDYTRMENNVVTFDVITGTYLKMVNADRYIKDGEYAYNKYILPHGEVCYTAGVIYYQDYGGRWCFNGKLRSEHELVNVILHDGEAYAVMHRKGDLRDIIIYRISDGADVTQKVKNGHLQFSEENRRSVHEGYISDAVDFTAEKLYDCQNNTVYAMTEDRSLACFYTPGERNVVCIDAVTGRMRTIPLSSEFVVAVQLAEKIEFSLYFNDDATEAILLYHIIE